MIIIIVKTISIMKNRVTLIIIMIITVPMRLYIRVMYMYI